MLRSRTTSTAISLGRQRLAPLSAPEHDRFSFHLPAVSHLRQPKRHLSSVVSFFESTDRHPHTEALRVLPRCGIHHALTPRHHFHHVKQHTRSFFSRHLHQPSTFVSKHNDSLKISLNDIVDFCESNGVDARTARTTNRNVTLQECPFCHPTRGKLDNQFKLSVKIGDGAFNCFRCGAKGSWFDFKARLSGGTATATDAREFMGGGAGGGGGYSSYGGRGAGGGGHGTRLPNYQVRPRAGARAGAGVAELTSGIPCLPMPSARATGVHSSMLLDGDTTNEALEYLLNTRKLERKTLRKYGVGRAFYSFPVDQRYQDMECITFPWILRESDIAFQESLRGAEYVMSKEEPKKKDVKEKKSKKKGVKKDKVSAKSKAKADENVKADSEEIEEDSDEHDVPDFSADTPEVQTGRFITRRIKARAVEQKGHQRLDPAGGGWGLFGYHTVPSDATEVVLTEGEFDAMAVWQATGLPAVSLPNGCRSLPVEVLPLLERFERIYLWMDNDEPGREGADKFAKKLGMKRCFLVQSPLAKDANEALIKGVDMMKLIADARVIPHERVLEFSHLRDQVIHELLHPDEYKGVEVPSLPGLTKIIKGFRRGEMTVLTGPTGSGKTTFLGQLSLDLAEQNVNMLWGSFEIKNTRLLQKLMQQYSRKALPKAGDQGAKETMEALADEFTQLPLYFLGFHGGSQVDEVLNAMEYAVYVNDVEHIILDNMQFMITRSDVGSRSSFDKFDVQDVAIEKFRKFATVHGVHVTLVVHPRKEDDSMKLNMASFYGSAKATQEADTVLILQKEDRRKYIDVKKNRFDGELGCTPLYFDRDSGRYTEDERGQLQDSRNTAPTAAAPTKHKFMPSNQRSADDVYNDKDNKPTADSEEDGDAGEEPWSKFF